jgi:hypothetical protein
MNEYSPALARAIDELTAINELIDWLDSYVDGLRIEKLALALGTN